MGLFSPLDLVFLLSGYRGEWDDVQVLILVTLVHFRHFSSLLLRVIHIKLRELTAFGRSRSRCVLFWFRTLLEGLENCFLRVGARQKTRL